LGGAQEKIDKNFIENQIVENLEFIGIIYVPSKILTAFLHPAKSSSISENKIAHSTIKIGQGVKPFSSNEILEKIFELDDV
jgi:hypothetical protein